MASAAVTFRMRPASKTCRRPATRCRLRPYRNSAGLPSPMFPPTSLAAGVPAAAQRPTEIHLKRMVLGLAELPWKRTDGSRNRGDDPMLAKCRRGKLSETPHGSVEGTRQMRLQTGCYRSAAITI